MIDKAPRSPRNLKSMSSCFFVKNAQKIDYYLSTLEFKVEKLWGEPPVFASLQKDGFTLMLHEVAEETAVNPNGMHEDAFDLYLQTDNIEMLYSDFTKKNAILHAPP